MIGLGFIIETIIYNFLGSYEYNPNFIKHNAFYDNNLGAFVSNAFSLPVTATLIASFSLNWIWIILFTGFFVGIEWLFLNLHIYSQNWWRLEYTALLFPVYFASAKVFYKWILHHSSRFKHNLILYLITSSISASTYLLPIIFFSIRIYRPGWFENQERDTIAFAAIFYLCSSLFYILMIKINLKLKWIKYIITGFLMISVNQVLIAKGVLKSLVWWDQPYYVCLSLFLLMITGIIDRKLTKGPILR
jgi:hypothetical protein